MANRNIRIRDSDRTGSFQRELKLERSAGKGSGVRSKFTLTVDLSIKFPISLRNLLFTLHHRFLAGRVIQSSQKDGWHAPLEQGQQSLWLISWGVKMLSSQ